MLGSFASSNLRDDKEARELSMSFPQLREKIEVYMDGTEMGNDIVVRIGLGLHGILKDYKDRFCRSLPNHCHNDYINFVKPSMLRKEAKKFTREAHKNWGSSDVNWKLVGFSQALASCFFYSQSWNLHRETPIDSRDIEVTPAYQRASIENFVADIIQKSGKTMP